MSRGIKILIGVVGALVLMFLIGAVLCTLLSAPVRSSGPESDEAGLPNPASTCVQSDSARPGSGVRYPFSVDMTAADGVRVSWQGRSDGHRPGAAETMRLNIDNNTSQDWNGRFCVQLLEPMPSLAVIPLTEQQFSVKSDDGLAQDVRVELPADLAPGIHGLALVVHEPAGSIVEVIPVQVGEGEGEPLHGDWPTQAALETCPLPQSASGGTTP